MDIKMDFGALTLFLLLGSSSLVFAVPSAPLFPVNEELEEQMTKFDPEQLEAVSSGLAELGKSGGVPRVLTLLETTVAGDQELELADIQAKSGLQTTLPRDCGRNPRYARTGGQKDNAPWLLPMGKGRGKNFRPFCIGTVISSHHLVANAICVIANEVDVVVSVLPNGELRLFEVLKRNVAGDVEAAGDFLVGRNLVLVTLKSPLFFSEYVQPACLPSLSTSANLQGQIRGATIYGFQITNGNLIKFSMPEDAYGPAVFYSLLKKFNAENPREQVRSVEIVATKHLGVVANFEQKSMKMFTRIALSVLLLSALAVAGKEELQTLPEQRRLMASAGPATPLFPVNEVLEIQEAQLDSDQVKVVSSGKDGEGPISVNGLQARMANDQDLNGVAKDETNFITVPLRSPLDEDCGRNPLFERTDGKEDNAPWMILLGKGKGEDFVGNCIGVLISSRHVIGPAICTLLTEMDSVRAFAPKESKIIEVLGTNKVPDAETFDDFLVGRNIVVVTLKKPITFSDNVQPACLPVLSSRLNIKEVYSNGTVYGIKNFRGDLQRFSRPVNVHGAVAFYHLLNEYNSQNPRDHVKSIELVSTKHLGVAVDYELFRHSALLGYNEGNRRFYVMGVGPVASDSEEPVALYTSTVPHRHWIEVVVRQ